MTSINIEGSPKTPTVNFNHETGVLSVKGRSIPENSIEFYKPLIDWIDNYSASPADKTVINIQLEYFNTSSSKCILDFLRKLEKLKQMNVGVKVFWFYDGRDEDMEEVGQDFKEILDLDIELVQNAEKR